MLESLEQSQTAKVMNLAEWRRSRLHEGPLPSGLTVTLRDVTMTDLMLTGKLPTSFVDLANDSAGQGKPDVDIKKMMENGAEFRLVLDELVKIALVIPKIGDVADDDHITLDELPNDDKMFIFNVINREVTALHSFRGGEAQPVATV
jgi:hypothetical protein